MTRSMVYLFECLTAVLTGLIIGWFSQQWFEEEVSEQRAITPILVKDSLTISDEVQPKSTAVFAKSDPTVASRIQAGSSEISHAQFIEELSLMDSQQFIDYLNETSAGKHSHSDKWLVGILQELPTITDAASWYRLVDYLQHTNWRHLTHDKSPIEDWLLSKIENAEQIDYWLKVLSEFGVHKPANIKSLVHHLDSFQTPELRASAILSIAKGGFVSDSPNWRKNLKALKGNVETVTAPYLNSKHELERASAVRALRQYPTNSYLEHIANALRDKSERVRISALVTLTGQSSVYNPEVLQELVSQMQAEDAGAFERVISWQMLQRYPLVGSMYEAVYEFGINDAQRLQRLYAESDRDARSQWDY